VSYTRKPENTDPRVYTPRWVFTLYIVLCVDETTKGLVAVRHSCPTVCPTVLSTENENNIPVDDVVFRFSNKNIRSVRPSHTPVGQTTCRAPDVGKSFRILSFLISVRDTISTTTIGYAKPTRVAPPVSSSYPSHVGPCRERKSYCCMVHTTYYRVVISTHGRKNVRTRFPWAAPTAKKKTITYRTSIVGPVPKPRPARSSRLTIPTDRRAPIGRVHRPSYDPPAIISRTPSVASLLLVRRENTSFPPVGVPFASVPTRLRSVFRSIVATPPPRPCPAIRSRRWVLPARRPMIFDVVIVDFDLIFFFLSLRLQFNNVESPGFVGFANLPNQVHRKSVKKGFEFTLMVVGESGLGKSTLVNSLFLTDLYPERSLPDAIGTCRMIASYSRLGCELYIRFFCTRFSRKNQTNGKTGRVDCRNRRTRCKITAHGSRHPWFRWCHRQFW